MTELRTYPFNPYFKQADIEKGNGFNGGYRSKVGDDMLSLQEIADRAGCSKTYVCKCIRRGAENPEHFIERMRRKI